MKFFVGTVRNTPSIFETSTQFLGALAKHQQHCGEQGHVGVSTFQEGDVAAREEIRIIVSAVVNDLASNKRSQPFSNVPAGEILIRYL